jgi:hypothetical protein
MFEGSEMAISGSSPSLYRPLAGVQRRGSMIATGGGETVGRHGNPPPVPTNPVSRTSNEKVMYMP